VVGRVPCGEFLRISPENFGVQVQVLAESPEGNNKGEDCNNRSNRTSVLVNLQDAQNIWAGGSLYTRRGL